MRLAGTTKAMKEQSQTAAVLEQMDALVHDSSCEIVRLTVWPKNKDRVNNEVID